MCPKLLPCCGALWRAGLQSHGRPLTHSKPGKDVPLPLSSRQHRLRDKAGAPRPRALREGEWGSAVPGDTGAAAVPPPSCHCHQLPYVGPQRSLRVSPDTAPRTTGFVSYCLDWRRELGEQGGSQLITAGEPGPRPCWLLVAATPPFSTGSRFLRFSPAGLLCDGQSPAPTLTWPDH